MLQEKQIPDQPKAKEQKPKPEKEKQPELTPEQEKAKTEMIETLSKGYVNKAIKIRDKFNVPDSVIASAEVQEAAKQEMINWLSKGDLYWAIKIRDKFNVPEKVAQEVAKQGMINCLSISNGRVGSAIEIRDKFNVPEKVAQEVAKQGMINCLSKGWVDKAIEIRDEFNVPDSVIASAEVQEAAKQKMINWLSKGWVDKAIQIRDEFNVPDSVIASAEVQEAAKQGMINCLSKGWVDDALEVRDKFNVPEKVVQEAAKQGMINWLSKGDLYWAIKIRDKFNVPEKVAQEVAKQGMINCLSKGWVDKAIQIRDKFNVPDSVIASAEVQEAAKQEMINCLSKSWVDYALEIRDKFNVPEKVVQEAAKQWMINELSNGYVGSAIEIRDEFNVPGEIGSMEKSAGDSFVKKMQITTWPELFKFVNNDKQAKDFLAWLLDNNQECLLDRQDLEKIMAKNLNYIEAQIIRQNDQDFDFGQEDNEKEIFEILTGEKGSKEWQDQENVVEPFEQGAERFGWQKMFEYSNREDISRHDALFEFNKILALLDRSELESEQFYAQILFQVKKDTSEYEDIGTSYHKINALARNVNLDIEQIIQEARQYKEINKLQKLLADLDSPEKVFSSWVYLKKYADICRLLQKKEILEKLGELKKEPGQEKLYNYVETLAFHPNIDMESVFRFWQEPESFLAGADEDSEVELHNRKKPSNYVEIPYLDLSAKELRDALIEGGLDQVQAFWPMEVEYRLPMKANKTVESSEQAEKTTRQIIREQLGYFDPQEKKRIKGRHKQAKKIFPQIQKFFKEHDIKMKEYMRAEQEQELPKEVEKQVLDILGQGKAEKIKGSVKEYRAKINLKSDPDGVVAGNDTSRCMPFGAGKNTVYTFNPNCALFTLQQKKADDNWRTIAQSVLTQDKKVKKNFNDILEEIKKAETVDIEQVLPESILNDEPFTLACDNVEVAPNSQKNPLVKNHIEMIYHDFFMRYLQRFARPQNLDPEQVVIGLGYADALTDLSDIDNTFVPAAPVSYSDKTHEKVYRLEPKLYQPGEKQIKIPEKPKAEQVFSSQIPGIKALNFEDALPVSVIESKAYHDNKELMQYLHNMENGLIAKDINNVAKQRPNMDLKYVGKDNKIHCYLFAYEGANEYDEYDEDYIKELDEDEGFVYVADIASDKTEKGIGRSLMMGFLEQYKKNYLDQDNPLPIFAQMREKTSYAIVKKNLAKYGERLGLKFDIQELGTYEEGEDTMHKMLIRVQ